MTLQTRYFVHAGSDVHIVKMNPEVSHTELKPKIYSANYHDMQGFFLTEIKDRFDLPPKVYGDTMRRANKVVRTFGERTQSLGALLTGNKGSGKTMLTQVIANTIMATSQLPIIMVSQPYKGDAFNRFINDIGECVVVFDEFGKMYDRDDQDYLLTFMDGSMSQKRLILLTENDQFLVNNFMMNRPGRILYHFEYGRLGKDVVQELCFDNDVPEKETKDIIDATSTVKELNIDIIKAIIGEWKIHREPIKDIIEDMNIQNRGSTEQFTLIKLVDRFGVTHTKEELKTQTDDSLIFDYDVSDGGGIGFNFYSISDKKQNGPFAVKSDDEESDDFGPSSSETRPHRYYAGFDFDDHFVHSDGTLWVLKNNIGDTIYLKLEKNCDRFNQSAY